MNIKPLNKTILAKRHVEEQKPQAILLIAKEDANPNIFLVLAVADDVKEIAVGDKILTEKYAGTKFTYADEEVFSFKEEQVIGVFGK